MICITGTYFYFASSLPKLNSLEAYQPPLVSRVYNPQGELLDEYADQHRILTPLSEIPQQLIDAFLAAEDEHFYQHPGINPARILSAAIANLRAGHVVQGGSTITQQVAKNLLLSPKRTYTRKIKEMILAHRMEQTLSKNDILYLYLNQIYLGRGAYGVASAAWLYFHKHLDQLTLAECAMLAGLPKAPSGYAPHLHPQRAKKRRDTVLHMMLNSGVASARDVAVALKEPIHVAPLPEPKLKNAYATRVYQALVDRFGTRTLRRQGLTIIVPYDPKAEESAIHAVRQGVLAVEQQQYYRGAEKHFEPAQWADTLKTWAEHQPDRPFERYDILPGLIEKVLPDGDLLVNDGKQRWRLPKPDWQWDPDIDPSKRVWRIGDEIMLQGTGSGGVRLTQSPSVEAALYSIDLQHGTMLAQVGGFDYHFGDFDRSTQADRQPGSAFKPFLYATAMDNGFTPATIIMDTPIVFGEHSQDQFWRPENYENRFAGPVTLRNALEHSRNLASIKLLQDIGIDRFLQALHNYQFDRKFPAQLALALGATEVSLKEMTESYAVIASGGRRWKPVAVQQVQDRNGKTLHRAVAGNRCQVCHADPVLGVGDGMQPAEQTLDPVSSFLTLNMMQGVIQHGTGRRARALHRPAAGKTGTTDHQVDAWFIGFTPQVLTGTWVGRDTPTSLGRRETGAHAALPIWLKAMEAFHRGKPVENFTPPKGVEWVAIDPVTGKLATPSTKHPFMEAFRTGTEDEAGVSESSLSTGNDSETDKKKLMELGL
ncbi:MAG TPA: PBP1A family penicillin-binding protein [Mariprofundaceae bacterium]|nr:PBP1A family penicillin-binding protein [Mariprofundaceae bacterium]